MLKTEPEKKIKNLFHFLAKFPKIAPYNLALIAAQRPGAVYVLSKEKWYKRHRKLRDDARPIIILRPFGPIQFVYDVSDTFGAPLPPEIEAPFKSTTKFDHEKFEEIIAHLPGIGVKYVPAKFGSQQAGYIELLSYFEILCVPPKEKKYKICYQICCNDKFSEAEQIATIAHELGHLFCGHLGALPFNCKKPPWPSRLGLTKNQVEFEAESVCWIVCERRKINNPSAEYLRGYLDEGKSIPQIDLGAILRAASQIEALLDGYYKSLECLLVDNK